MSPNFQKNRLEERSSIAAVQNMKCAVEVNVLMLSLYSETYSYWTHLEL